MSDDGSSFGESSRHPASRHPVLRFTRSQIELGPKTWIAVGLAMAIIALGVWVSPGNFWTGIGVGVAGIFGAILGILVEKTPIPRDFTPIASSAVRGLAVITRNVENIQTLATQLASVDNDPDRVRHGIIDAQFRLIEVQKDLYVAISEWDNVAPGALEEYKSIRDAGTNALALLSEELENESE